MFIFVLIFRRKSSWVYLRYNVTSGRFNGGVQPLVMYAQVSHSTPVFFINPRP